MATDLRLITILEQATGCSTDAAEQAWLNVQSKPRMFKRLHEIVRTRSTVRWLLEDIIERGVLAIMAGPRGVYKSFTALHWAMQVALAGHPVAVISAEGNDLDRRINAWLLKHAPDVDPTTLPLIAMERRIDLTEVETIRAIRDECVAMQFRPVLFVLDTYSKLSGGLDENDNTAVKAFIGLLDKGLKRPEAFDATVLLVAHTGHSDNRRPRGASAFGADTDCEYIASMRAGAVRITRERFKSSPSLPALNYRPEILPLGYADEKGRPVTSVAMVEAEPSRATADKPEPTGMYAVPVWKALKELAPLGGCVSQAAVLDAAVDKLPVPDPGEKDRRRERCKSRGLARLEEHEFIEFGPDGTVRLAGAVAAAPEEFENAPD